MYQETMYSELFSARILQLVFGHRPPKISADFDEFVSVFFPNRHYSAIYVIRYNEVGLHSCSFHYRKVYRPFVPLYENSFWVRTVRLLLKLIPWDLTHHYRRINTVDLVSQLWKENVNAHRKIQ